MLPDATAAPTLGAGIIAQLPPLWRAALIRLGLAWCALIVLFWSDWTAMARQWWDISTYNHVLLIPAILAWLVWQRAPQLARLDPAAWWPGLVLAAGAALLWLLGAFAGLTIARQAGAVALLIAAALTLLGPRASAGLAFPLAYMGFLVPFGDELVPALQMVTAKITIALVHLSGVPAQIDGVFIDTPAGLFEVAEACSGVKFLIAMIAFGALAANVCFVSWRRRALFMTVCLAVPVLANGIRAWGTVFAAQYVGVERAAGFDHIIYGWVFFAFVIALVLAMSWRFFDRAAGGAMIDADAIAASPLIGRLGARTIGAVPALALLAAIVLGGQAWARTAGSIEAVMPSQIALLEVPGWHRIDYAPAAPWQPRAAGADHRLLGRYADGQGHEVDVFFALYASQREGREAGGFGEGALPTGGAWSWHSPGPKLAGAKSDRLLAGGRHGRLALTWYRTGDLTTGSNARLKLANMQGRLLLRPRPTSMLILSAEERPGKPAIAAIAAFHSATGPTGAWMDRTALVR